MENTMTDSNIPANTEPFQNLFTEQTYYYCLSVSLFIKKIINEDLILHNLVSLERTGKTDH